MALRSPLSPRIVLATLILSTTPVHAGAPDDPKVEAKQHFERARDAKNAGHYDLAITEFRAAYARFPSPSLLYNIGQMYLAKGDKKSALQFFRDYLKADPNGDGAADARERVASLSKELEPPSVASPVGRSPTVKAEGTAPLTTPITTTSASSEASPIYRRWWLWTAVGGVAAAGVGLGIGLGAYQSAQGPPLCPECTGGDQYPYR